MLDTHEVQRRRLAPQQSRVQLGGVISAPEILGLGHMLEGQASSSTILIVGVGAKSSHIVLNQVEFQA